MWVCTHQCHAIFEFWLGITHHPTTYSYYLHIIHTVLGGASQYILMHTLFEFRLGTTHRPTIHTYYLHIMTVTYYFTYKSSLHTILHTNDDYATFMLLYAKLCHPMLNYARLCYNYANYALCSDCVIMPKSNAGIIGLPARAPAARGAD